MRGIIVQLASINALVGGDMRYDTAGDWEFKHNDNSATEIKVVVVPQKEHMGTFLVALHELVEAYLCLAADIEQETVDEWDLQHPELDEPGDDPRAPYHKQHVIATKVEQLICKELGIDWEELNNSLETELSKEERDATKLN